MTNSHAADRLASIIITNYNYGQFVGEAIESALGQTHRPLEVIVVDDASTDNSREVIESFGDEVRLVAQEHSGQTAAINRGFSVSNGEVVVFLDADDTLAREIIAHAVGALGPGVTRVYWPLRVVDEQGHPTGATVPDWGEPPEGDLRSLTLERGPDAYAAPPQSGNAFARELLHRVLPLPRPQANWGSTHADLFMIDLAGLYGSAVGIAEPHGTYRVHGSNDWAGLSIPIQQSRLEWAFEARCRELESHCERLGLDADSAAWRRNSPVLRAIRARRTLEAVLDNQARLILLDDNQLGPWVLGERLALPFLERDGEYWGSPVDDDQAIAEFERLRARAEFLVLLWPAFWWMDCYPGFARYLEQTTDCVQRTEELVIYALGNRTDVPDRALAKSA